MRGLRRGAWAIAPLIALGLWGCHRPKIFVTKAEVSSAGISAEGWCGLSASTLRARLLEKLKALPHVEVVGAKDAEPKKATHYEVLLVPVPPAEGKVQVAVILRRVKAGVGARYQLGAEAKLPANASVEVEKRVGLAAVDRALDAARLRIASFEKTNSQLLEDAKSQDVRVRSFALRTLADRGDRRAIPGLVKSLRTRDPFELRRTLGALVALRAVETVPKLIDASRGTRPEFRRELIYAIGQIGGEDARGYLYVVSVGANQPALRSAAHEALVELSARTAEKESKP